jgi:hypothetical protein
MNGFGGRIENDRNGFSQARVTNIVLLYSHSKPHLAILHSSQLPADRDTVANKKYQKDRTSLRPSKASHDRSKAS